MIRVAFIFAAVVLSGCGAPKPHPDGTLPESVWLFTETHRGHDYVVNMATGQFIHSPACHCGRRWREVE